LKHDGTTGESLGALVPHNDPNAPFAPRGIVLNGDALFVADTSSVGKNNPPGRLLAYTGGGVFLADLTPDPITEFPGAFSTDEFHPRGVVLGPDGLLYVSVTHDLDPKSANFNPLAGWVLRFNPNDNGAFVDVFASDDDAGCAADLHRPEGLVFDSDGKLYVTAFRADSSDTDKILIFDGTGACVDQIDLDQVGQPRAFAQALLFGPGDDLFVPISGDGPDTGAVRRYDVTDPTFPFTNFVPPGGPLGQGWYLTFGETDSGTLAYP
jgi:sugar lactone lactonase YvrE